MAKQKQSFDDLEMPKGVAELALEISQSIARSNLGLVAILSALGMVATRLFNGVSYEDRSWLAGRWSEALRMSVEPTPDKEEMH